MENQEGNTAQPRYRADTDQTPAAPDPATPRPDHRDLRQRCRDYTLEHNPFFSRIRTYDPETGERYLSVWDPDWPEDWREQIDRQTMQLNEFFVAEILREDDDWLRLLGDCEQGLSGDSSDGPR